jgi:hypothetical protein
MNNVKSSGSVKIPQIGQRAIENKRQAVKPIKVALGIAAGAISSHFSSVLMIWRSQTAKYAKITEFMAKQTKPKLNGILRMRGS